MGNWTELGTDISAPRSNSDESDIYTLPGIFSRCLLGAPDEIRGPD